MNNNIKNELIIGLAGGLGIDFDKVSAQLSEELAAAGYHTEIIRISDFFPNKKHPSKFAKEYWKMQYGTQQRQSYGNDYWARRCIEKIYSLRQNLNKKHNKVAYIVRSLKNKAELQLLANVYGKNFIAVSIFSEEESVYKHLKSKLKTMLLKDSAARQQMRVINDELGLSDEEPDADLVEFLLRKDQEETHPLLKSSGQNLFECYSAANFFVYQDKDLKKQVNRFIKILFNYPFAEPSTTEYFMFCAQAAAYRSLDVDRQVGAVIVNPDFELVATGFNDVTKLGDIDLRDFKQECDFGHLELDKIAEKITDKIHLDNNAKQILRQELSGITEFKRSTHAEMSAIIDACKRGVAIRDCIMYVNYYPCHNCTKHIIASGIRKVVFLHPYTKSKAREMYQGMIKNGLFTGAKTKPDVVQFEPFLGVSPNKYMHAFANDKHTRLERVDGKENGKIAKWRLDHNSIPADIHDRQPYTYSAIELSIIQQLTQHR